MSTEFVDYLKVCGIVSQLTPPYTPQLNGVAEHKNQTLLDMVRSMLSYIDLPISLWGYAMLTVIFLLNWVLTKSISTMPYEIWVERPLILKHVWIWGCPVYVKRLKIENLDPRFEKGQFMGYPKDSLGYYVYFLADPRVVVDKHIIFLEKAFIQKGGMG